MATKRGAKGKHASKSIVESSDEAESSAEQGLATGSSDPQYRSARQEMIAAGEDSEDEYDNGVPVVWWPHPAWPGTAPDTVAQEPQAQFTHLRTLSDKDPYICLVDLVSHIPAAQADLRLPKNAPKLFWEAIKSNSALWKESTLAPDDVSSRGTIMTSCIGKLSEYVQSGREGSWWWSEAVKAMTLAAQKEIANTEAAGIPANTSTSGIRRNPTRKAQPPHGSIHIPRSDEEFAGVQLDGLRPKPRPMATGPNTTPGRQTDMDTLAEIDTDFFPPLTFDTDILSNEDEGESTSPDVFGSSIVPEPFEAPVFMAISDLENDETPSDDDISHHTPLPADGKNPEKRPQCHRKPPSRADSLYPPPELTKPANYKTKRKSTKGAVQSEVGLGKARPSSRVALQGTDVPDDRQKRLSSVLNTPRKGTGKRRT
ncbi:hypothetical protein OF83DRAFT_1087701 [Amylostereum chailletii]|nr:hypothetical protein OF83DRAFT_1087701 [Amylostereum chailletii]